MMGSSVWFQRPLVMTVLVCLVALTPLAYATPTDPLWIAGVYDGADLDDVILTIVSADGVRERPALPLIRPGVLGCLPVEEAERPAAFTLPACRIRAPPGV